jgi:hypothetical protein
MHGKLAQILWSLHRFTERLTASRMAAGEACLSSQTVPRSSTKESGASAVHRSLCRVATVAAAGPATVHQLRAPAAEILLLARQKAPYSWSVGTQLSHQAVAQRTMGSACASTAGSTTTPAASSTWNTKSGDRPYVSGDAALATVARSSWSGVSGIPHTSRPYDNAGIPAMRQ